MRLAKLMTCVLLVCALALPMAFGETDPTPTPEPAPTQESTPTPEPAPTQESASTPEPTQTQEPTPTPESTQTQEPTAIPEPTQAQEPTPTPEPTPTQESTAMPEPAPTQEPAVTPEPDAEPSVSPAPGTTTLPTPGELGNLVNIIPEGSAKQENEVWKIQLPASDSPLSFVWTVSGEASGYLVYMQTGEDKAVFIAQTTDTRIELPSANYAQGQHTLYVGAVLTDGSITWGNILFELASQQSGFPGGFPGGFSGGGRPGGFGSTGTMGGMTQEEQDFRVTPGKALTGKHSSGTKDTTAYTHSEIVDSDEAMTALVLSSTQTEITLDNGAAFFATNENGKLELVPESAGSEWQLNALALNTLNESGIDRAVFRLSGTSCSILTGMEFSGSVYASLRAKGYVSKDMEIRVNAHGVRVHIAGGVYSINSSGELMPREE